MVRTVTPQTEPPPVIAVAPPRPPALSLARPLAVPLLAYAASRVITTFAIALAAMASRQSFQNVMTVWDGRWYVRIALHGYPHSVPQGDFYAGTGRQVQSSVAFFPLYSLLTLLERRWLVAGVLAALAGATRPNATAAMLACAWAAGVAIWQNREWRAAVAPLLAPVGMLAFFVFLWWHTGETLIWFRVESQGWGERIDLGWSNLGVFADVVTRPLYNPNKIVLAISMVSAVVLLVILV